MVDEKYIVIANDSPVLTMAKSDFVAAVKAAEDYASYLRRNVTVLRLRGIEVDVAHIEFYKKS